MTTLTWLRSGADVSLGIADVLLTSATAVNRRGAALAGPALGTVSRTLSHATHTDSLARDLQARGARVRSDARIRLSLLLDRLVPSILAAVLQRTDLTAVVHEQVDIDQLVKDVDLDGVASRLDIDAVAARLDVDAVVARLDLTRIVLERVDLTRIVLERVDMDRVVPDVLAHIDLVGIAEYLIDAIDLPQIVRDSSGALASDTVRGARLRGVAGDRAIQRLRDRMLHGDHGNHGDHGDHGIEGPGSPEANGPLVRPPESS